MKYTDLKNVIVFKAHLPDADSLSGHLSELLFSDITENEMSKSGFFPNLCTGELVTPFEGGMAFSLRLDEKILPSQVLRKEVQARVAQIENAEGRTLKKSEVQDIKYSVAADLCKVAFVKTTVISCYYNIEHKLLMVATGSKPLSQLAVSSLVKAVGSVKTETINIDNIKLGLTTKLLSYISSGGAPFDGFIVGEYVQISRQIEQREVVKYTAEIGNIADELQVNLNDGFVVDQIALYFNGIAFRLTDKFHLKQIIFDEILPPDDVEDEAFLWRHEAAVATLQVTGIINQLCQLLSYKPNESNG
ncbi:recombination-associated protein RdgC [Leminorella grimontii]|uniref:recombination-associated protein RdgC n=1 Tax=Leminorella grimontii TaxID=82981 RepID=UPI00207DC97A|nr:recombination-associated protein RdgC [Leminorella grimontii]GKX61426.1 recombination-associated protein RdgC [Leminorella grimontii]